MLLVFLISFPLVGGLVLLLLKHSNPRWIATTVAGVEWIASLLMVASFAKDSSVQFVVNVPWVTSLGMNFSIGADGISLLLILLTTTLVPLIVLSSYHTEHPDKKNYYGLIFIMQAALVGVFCAQDGLLFYLFWEMALIPIYFICLIWGGEGRGAITLKFFIYTLAGSLLMLVALIYVYLHTPGEHTFDLQAMYTAGRSLSGAEQSWVFWGLFIAFAIKMPVFPLHTWQPDTYTVAPVQGTMLLSGIMLKMGTYGVIRWIIPMVPAGLHEWGLTAVVLSVAGIVYASCIAMVQNDMKRLVAYSSIAHVGLISAGILTQSVSGLQGAMIQMISHGIVVVGLFYAIEIIFLRTQTRQLGALGGIRNSAPLFTSAFIVIMLGSVALPLTSGFIGEFLLIMSVFEYNPWLGFGGGLTIILGAVYMLVMFQKSMSGESKPTTAAFPDLTFREKFVLYIIVILIVGLGLYPAMLMDISEPAIRNLVDSLNSTSASLK
jgi:NADH-quinone oxidoreductase subunit M